MKAKEHTLAQQTTVATKSKAPAPTSATISRPLAKTEALPNTVPAMVAPPTMVHTLAAPNGVASGIPKLVLQRRRSLCLLFYKTSHVRWTTEYSSCSRWSSFQTRAGPDCLWPFHKTTGGNLLSENPLFVIVDTGCTKSMGSRTAIEAFRQHCGTAGITTEILPSTSCFTFAGGGKAKTHEMCRVWSPTTPPTHTDVDICEQSTVPILLSVFQMMNMNMSLGISGEKVLLTCPTLGMKGRPCRTSTSHHRIINLADIQKPPHKSLPTSQSGVCAFHNLNADWDEVYIGKSSLGVCPACESKHRSHTYDEN